MTIKEQIRKLEKELLILEERLEEKIGENFTSEDRFYDFDLPYTHYINAVDAGMSFLKPNNELEYLKEVKRLALEILEV